MLFLLLTMIFLPDLPFFFLNVYLYFEVYLKFYLCKKGLGVFPLKFSNQRFTEEFSLYWDCWFRQYPPLGSRLLVGRLCPINVYVSSPSIDLDILWKLSNCFLNEACSQTLKYKMHTRLQTGFKNFPVS